MPPIGNSDEPPGRGWQVLYKDLQGSELRSATTGWLDTCVLVAKRLRVEGNEIIAIIGPLGKLDGRRLERMLE